MLENWKWQERERKIKDGSVLVVFFFPLLINWMDRQLTRKGGGGGALKRASFLCLPSRSMLALVFGKTNFKPFVGD